MAKSAKQDHPDEGKPSFPSRMCIINDYMFCVDFMMLLVQDKVQIVGLERHKQLGSVSNFSVTVCFNMA